jgi:hypothetical protein
VTVDFMGIARHLRLFSPWQTNGRADIGHCHLEEMMDVKNAKNDAAGGENGRVFFSSSCAQSSEKICARFVSIHLDSMLQT